MPAAACHHSPGEFHPCPLSIALPYPLTQTLNPTPPTAASPGRGRQELVQPIVPCHSQGVRCKQRILQGRKLQRHVQCLPCCLFVCFDCYFYERRLQSSQDCKGLAPCAYAQ